MPYLLPGFSVNHMRKRIFYVLTHPKPGFRQLLFVTAPYLLPTKSLCIDKEKVGRR